MGLIINKNIPMLKTGYPTVSDKYNITGAVLTGNTPVVFGDVVKFSATKGYFEKATAMASVAEVAGFVLATNVKLNLAFGGDKVETLPGEAFNLTLPNTFLAVELAESAVEGNIAANKKVAIKLADGTLSTSGVANFIDLPNVVFTGVYEKHGETIVAEIYIK